MHRIDLTGKRFGRLSVINSADLNHNNQLRWHCKCDCGQFVDVVGMSLRNGDTTSCGCARRDIMRKTHTKHGAYISRSRRERLYNIYSDMKQRCYDTSSKPYKDYGGRGILICEEWLNDYSLFRSWAISHGYHSDLTIDRINNDKGYSPENCRWADRITQNRNRRNTRGNYATV